MPAPSHKNTVNQTRERRNAQRQTAPAQSMEVRYTKHAESIIAMQLIEKTATGYEARTPAVFGRFQTYAIENGVCDCACFDMDGFCSHSKAAEILDARETVKPGILAGLFETGDAPVEYEASGAASANILGGLFICTDNVAQILQSKHVASVEVGLDESYGDTRIYSAISNDKGVPHRYTVRVTDDFSSGERATTAKCNCLASAKGLTCRHTIAVAKADAEFMKREIFPNQIATYRAYKRAA